MTSLWAFLYFTGSLSLTAALLLVVKALLRDKLSPRWQYGVWSVLALQMLLPMGAATRGFSTPILLLLETVKGAAGADGFSAYGQPGVIQTSIPFPLAQGTPKSVADWLFVLYALGVVAALLWDIASSVRLRRLLKKSPPATAAAREQLDYVCKAYQLSTCKICEVPQLSTCFVCGVIRPILAIPAGSAPPDAVLLHELLHRKYLDAAQNWFWCFFRALNWCNPFLRYVFRQIQNDLEALCDQRVLELLSGEARRDYGSILLSMVNDRYPCVPGTTSLSNGGKNISRRIESIARFKRYPRGMALVSVCIVIVLTGSLFQQSSVLHPDFSANRKGVWGTAYEMASARVFRCGTVAGALDTYAKGLLLKNRGYLASALPLSDHTALNAGGDAYTCALLPQSNSLNRSEGYQVLNLRALPAGGYAAMLVFSADSLLTETDDYLRDEHGELQSGMITLPVTVLRQDGGWSAAPSGSSTAVPLLQEYAPWESAYETLPVFATYRGEGPSGDTVVQIQTICTAQAAASDDNLVTQMFGGSSFDSSLNRNAAFSQFQQLVHIIYTFGGSEAQRKTLSMVGLQVIALDSLRDKAEFAKWNAWGFSGSGDGNECSFSRPAANDWNGVAEEQTRCVADGKQLPQLPAGYAVQVRWNGEVADIMTLRQEVADGT